MAASFDVDCINGYFWHDPKTDYSWWAGHDPIIPSDFDTSPTTPGTPPYHHTTGQLHFDDETHATYTSDAGGHLGFVRQPLNGMYTADCKIGPA